MKRVFVCSPLQSATLEGFHYNRRLARELTGAVLKAGHAPFTPHLWYSEILDDSRDSERAKGMEAGAVWLRMADEIWVYAAGREECSAGMRSEVDLAERLQLPVRVVWMPEPFADVKARHLADPPPSAPAPAPSFAVRDLSAHLPEKGGSFVSVGQQLVKREDKIEIVVTRACGCDSHGPALACQAEGLWHGRTGVGRPLPDLEDP